MSPADSEKAVDSEQSSTQIVPIDHGVDGKQDSKEETNGRKQENGHEPQEVRPTKWSMGILNDTETNEVPGMSVRRSILGATY